MVKMHLKRQIIITRRTFTVNDSENWLFVSRSWRAVHEPLLRSTSTIAIYYYCSSEKSIHISAGYTVVDTADRYCPHQLSPFIIIIIFRSMVVKIAGVKNKS